MQSTFRLGKYDKARASALKIESGNYPGHGKIPPPPPGARTGYGIFNRDKWIGFVELTRPFKKQKVHENRKAAFVGVGILPEYRKQGIAEKAAQELMQKHPEVKKWWWQALHSNKPSLGLGKKLGFKGGKMSEKYTTLEKTAGLLEYLGLKKRKLKGSIRRPPRTALDDLRLRVGNEIAPQGMRLYKKYDKARGPHGANWKTADKVVINDPFVRRSAAKHGARVTGARPGNSEGNWKISIEPLRKTAAQQTLPVNFPKTTKLLQTMSPKKQAPAWRSNGN